MILGKDPIVERFVEVYGVRKLLDDLGLEKIRKNDQYWMCLCPFHDNRREPDFQIHRDLGVWNCFGCARTGNLYSFVHDAYRLSWDDANALILRLAGFDADIDLDDIRFASQMRALFTPETDENESRVKQPVITKKLITQMNTGPDPYDYLLHRGFSEETIKYFECTFTNRWGPVWHDDVEDWCYEERVIVPGHDALGKIIGYIGRTPVGDEPKYRYLKGYPKSKTLFNLHRAKEHAHQGLILVEGPLDAMQLHNLGFPNVVAIYGASLSKAQIDLICAYTDKVYLMFDNDKAGHVATKKAIEDLKDLVDVNVVGLQNYKDPGELREHEECKRIIKGSINWFQFNLNKSIHK